MWILYAVLSAIFAALTAITAKIGIQNVNSNLATAIRTIVILALAWSIVFIGGSYKQLPNISTRSLIFLVISGLCTGLSWLCYFYALKEGPVNKVVPIDKFSLVITIVLSYLILQEALTLKIIIGGILITIGTLITII